jgi:Fic family protein
LNEIRVQLAAAWSLRSDRDGFLRHCALFHHAFVHAHPFGNINNSIAMNIVNDLFGRAGIGVVPHLYLDQVALFLQPEDYVRLFERAVAAHLINDEVGRDRPATQALLEGVASGPFPGGR